jgi:hypothetical protein
LDGGTGALNGFEWNRSLEFCRDHFLKIVTSVYLS